MSLPRTLPLLGWGLPAFPGDISRFSWVWGGQRMVPGSRILSLCRSYAS